MSSSGPVRRKRQATFSFKGIVAAQDRDAAKSMRNAIEHICTVIIDTYRVCMDQSKGVAEKAEKLAQISDVENDLKYILDFVRAETNACKVERVRVQMAQLSSKMDDRIRGVIEELRMIRSDPHLYQKVFDGIIEVLTDNTSFLKLGHSVEQARVLDVAFQAVTEVRAVRDAATMDDLVNAGQLASASCINLLRAANRLCSVQEKANADLIARLQAAHTILQSALPQFLNASRAKVEFPNDDNVDKQQDACQQLTGVLEEVISIIREVRADYDSSFADQIMADSGMTEQQRKLAGAVKNVGNMLAKLHAAAEEADKTKIQQEVVALTKEVASGLNATGNDDDTVEFVQAIKQGVGPNTKDFFQAQKKINAIAAKATRPTKGVAGEEEASKDMLEAAKDMLGALKGVSSALADAPELKGM